MQAKLFSFVIFAILSVLARSAYSLDLEGRVQIRGSRDPGAELNLILLPSKKTALTDATGYFKVEGIEPGPQKVVINQEGFDRFEEEIRIEDPPKSLTLFIDKKSAADFETTVVTNVLRDPSKREISIKKAAAQAGAGADPIRALQNLPGVNRSSGFNARVVIQGSAPQDTAYAIDSHEIPLIFHFGGLSSVLIPELTQGFDYLSAGYQSNYGRAMGGIINLNTKKLESPRWHASAFIDTFNAGVALETPVGKDSHFAVGGRLSYIGAVLKAVVKEDSVSLTVAPSYQDVSFIFDTPISDRARFRLLGIGSADALEFVVKETGGDPTLRGDFESTLGFFRFIPSVTWKHSSQSESQFSIGFGRDFIFTSIGDQYFNLRSTSMTVRFEHKRKWDQEWTQTLGVDHRYTWSDVSLRLPRTYNEGGISNPISSGTSQILNLNSVKSHQIGIYTQAVYRATGSAWTLIPGLRLDSFTANRRTHLSPKLGARYELSPGEELVFGSGLYFQPPEEQETASVYGNPNLQSPSAIHLRLGYERDLSDIWSRGSTLYSGVFSRWFRDLVLPNVNQYYSNDGAGRSFGWETQLQYQNAPWDAALIYTLSRSTRSNPSQPEYLFRFDQTHLLTLMAGVDLPRRWRISARFRYVTGPVQTLPLGGVADLDNDVYIPIRGALNSERLQPFAMFDIRFDKKWVYDTWTLNLYLDIINVLNRKNTESLQYSYDYQRSLPVDGIPILPTFGLKGEF